MLKKTCVLLTAALLGWMMLAPAAFAKGPSYGYNYQVYGGSVQGNGWFGPARMAGSIPITSNRRLYNPRTRRWGQPTQFQHRYTGGSDYAGLNN